LSLPSRPSRRAIPGALAGALLATSLAPLLPRPAQAHALVMSSTPEPGARLASPPTRISLRFNSRIDHGRSRMTLFGPDNQPVPLALAPETDAALVEAPLPATLAAGAFRLRWQVLAVDGHITRGDIFFSVIGR
jgi:methionine-rich copper-binding protein CopC